MIKNKKNLKLKGYNMYFVMNNIIMMWMSIFPKALYVP